MKKIPEMVFFQRKRRSFLIEFMKRERVNEIRKRVPEATRTCCKTSPAQAHIVPVLVLRHNHI